VKLRLDEMVPPAIAGALRDRGHDADAVVEHAGLRGLPDARQLELATEEGRSLVTYDVGDYVPLVERRIANGQAHVGLILLSSNRFPPGTVGPVADSLAALLDDPSLSPGFVRWLQ